MQERYSRQTKIPGFGGAGQTALAKAKVLIIGCGGLGCPVAMYLSRAGLGEIGLVDADTISLSNLHRQVLFVESDIGGLKVDAAKSALLKGNSGITVHTYPSRLNSQNYNEIIVPYDLVLDCTDNFDTRYLINDACLELGKPLVYGAANRLEGQVAVFNVNGSGHLRDLFPEVPTAGTIQNCEEAGVLGVTTGIVGDLMALEVIKLVTAVGDPLINQLLQFDGLNTRLHVLKYTRNLAIQTEAITTSVPCVSWLDYDAKYQTYQLVDVRTSTEREVKSRGGIHIPLDELNLNEFHIKQYEKIAFYCQTGQRAQQAVSHLSKTMANEMIAIVGNLEPKGSL
ncbi:MAG: molybdopterin/thiamine biosynthesis adenylyltransferase/rhodanese-related sulfurtransferase [Bacteroidia bacterium]|jgi:molybdopterin/thiamine biosynthesis adenylyltransferase/rhodanese-related sulfurtransferase